jgi:hypothetical protein
MYSRIPLSELIKNNDKKELGFIHTPKCAGSYVSTILSSLKIKNFGHQQAIPDNKYIYFTVIRHPIDRFESLLNFRLDNYLYMFDFPEHLINVYHDIKITLDEIISKMTDEDILGFKQYRTLNYWTKNVDIIITIEKLPTLLEYFGYKYDINEFKKVNVSNKLRGRINQENRERIRKIFHEDIELYNKVIDSKNDI